MFHNGEIEHAIQLFEKSEPHLPYTGGSLEKEPRENWRSRQFYSHGAVNDQFLAFLAGYSAGKSAECPAKPAPTEGAVGEVCRNKWGEKVIYIFPETNLEVGQFVYRPQSEQAAH